MNSSDYSALLTQVIEGNSLSFQQSEAFFEQVICGNVAPEVLAAMLTALKMKKKALQKLQVQPMQFGKMLNNSKHQRLKLLIVLAQAAMVQTLSIYQLPQHY